MVPNPDQEKSAAMAVNADIDNVKAGIKRTFIDVFDNVRMTICPYFSFVGQTMSDFFQLRQDGKEGVDHLRIEMIAFAFRDHG